MFLGDTEAALQQVSPLSTNYAERIRHSGIEPQMHARRCHARCLRVLRALLRQTGRVVGRRVNSETGSRVRYRRPRHRAYPDAEVAAREIEGYDAKAFGYLGADGTVYEATVDGTEWVLSPFMARTTTAWVI